MASDDDGSEGRCGGIRSKPTCIVLPKKETLTYDNQSENSQNPII